MQSSGEKPSITQNDDALEDQLLEGELIAGKYRIIELVGRGGMGQVYEAENLTLGKRVALKFIDAQVASTTDGLERFDREARAAGWIESSHIVQVFDVGRMPNGKPFIVMELLRGETLGQRIARVGRMDPIQAIHIVMQTLRGLHRAHQVGIIHRDLKPDNVFLVQTDGDPSFVKILDFGISKFIGRARPMSPSTPTERGVVLGSPYYIAPEQARSVDDLDVRADIWSMGAILYECLAGERAFAGDTYEQVIIAICTSDPVPLAERAPHVPQVICDIVMRALSREREERFESAMQMLEALQQAVPQLMEASFAQDVPTTPPLRCDSSSLRSSTPSLPDNHAFSSPSAIPSPGRVRRRKLNLTIAVLAMAATSALLVVLVQHAATDQENGPPNNVQTQSPTLSEGFSSTTTPPTNATIPSSAHPTAPSSVASHLAQNHNPPDSPPVTVHVQTNAPQALVEVDGITSKDGSFGASAGQSKVLSVSAPGFEPVKRMVHIEPGQTTIRIDLNKETKQKPSKSSRTTGTTTPLSSGSNPLTGGLELKTDLP